MTNKELAAQCLIEAANILNDKEEVIEESYGTHGVMSKAMEEKLKNIPKDTEKRYNQYVKAGYEDKIPNKLYMDYWVKKDLERATRIDNNIRHKPYLNKTNVGRSEARKYGKDSYEDKAKMLDSPTAKVIARDLTYSDTKVSNASKRINKRAGMKESIDYMFDDIDFSDILD